MNIFLFSLIIDGFSTPVQIIWFVGLIIESTLNTRHENFQKAEILQESNIEMKFF